LEAIFSLTRWVSIDIFIITVTPEEKKRGGGREWCRNEGKRIYREKMGRM